MNEREDTADGDWEAELDALLAGELDSAATRRLQARAGGDELLATAIADASALRQAMAALPVERAPAGLRRKLRRIPRDQQSGQGYWYWRPAWLATLAAGVVAIIVTGHRGVPEPDAQAIARGRQDLGIALAYLDRTTLRASREIEAAIDHSINGPVTASIVTVLDQQLDLNRE